MIIYFNHEEIAFYVSKIGSRFTISTRKDIAATYIRLIADVSTFTKDASDLMIENAWLEEPPQANDRKALSRT
jgi:hypothetical protein